MQLKKHDSWLDRDSDIEDTWTKVVQEQNHMT